MASKHKRLHMFISGFFQEKGSAHYKANVPKNLKLQPENISPLSSKTCKKEHNIIATAWEKVAEEEMYYAAVDEKQLATQAGEIGPDGLPMLTVVMDGCWVKRLS
ncbi:hypothetical protein TNCV_4093641 [Trichonephila clavipes]|nr:hypothetical protein TNCV_4093641 [Trichonephila clavipes]